MSANACIGYLRGAFLPALCWPGRGLHAELARPKGMGRGWHFCSFRQQWQGPGMDWGEDGPHWPEEDGDWGEDGPHWPEEDGDWGEDYWPEEDGDWGEDSEYWTHAVAGQQLERAMEGPFGLDGTPPEPLSSSSILAHAKIENHFIFGTVVKKHMFYFCCLSVTGKMMLRVSAFPVHVGFFIFVFVAKSKVTWGQSLPKGRDLSKGNNHSSSLPRNESQESQQPTSLQVSAALHL